MTSIKIEDRHKPGGNNSLDNALDARYGTEQRRSEERDRRTRQEYERQQAELANRISTKIIEKVNASPGGVATASEMAKVVTTQLAQNHGLIESYVGNARSRPEIEAAMDRLVTDVENVFNKRPQVSAENVANNVRRRQNSQLSNSATTVEINEVREAVRTFISASYTPNLLGIDPGSMMLKGAEVPEHVVDETMRIVAEAERANRPRANPGKKEERQKRSRLTEYSYTE